MTVPFHRGGIVLLSAAVAAQFLLEVTLGRLFVAPNVLALALVYLMLNRNIRWSIDGAFWSGLCLDLLLHQPPGASSLALISGLYISRRIAGASAGESRMMLLILTAIATAVSDTVFIVAASRFRGWSSGYSLLMVIPRVAITAGTGIVLASSGSVISLMRRERHSR